MRLESLSNEALAAMVAGLHPFSSKCEDILVQRNRNLVWEVVNKYTTYNMALEDMFSEGCIGLIRAARKFDPSRNMRFSTYAVAWIRQSVGRAVANSGQVRVPEYLLPLIRAYKRAAEDFPGATGEQICQILGWELRHLETVEVALSVQRLVELDAPRGTRDTRPLSASLVSNELSPEQVLLAAIAEEKTERLLSCLKPRERHVVLRNLSGESMTTIAQQTGMTRQGVGAIIKRSLRKLQAAGAAR